MWKCQQIDIREGKSQRGDHFHQSIFMIWNPRFPYFRFRCEATRQNNLDRLICMIIDATGNNIQFDEFSTKQTVDILNRKNSSSFKDVQIYIKDGLIKILLKQKIFMRTNKNKENSQKALMTDYFFKPRLQKLTKFLEVLNPDLEKCSKLMGKTGLTQSRYGYSSEAQKISKQLQLKLFNDIKNVYKAEREQIKQVLEQIKKGEDQMRHDNFDDDDRHENYFKTTSTGKTINTITKYTYNQDFKTGQSTTTGSSQNKTNFFQISKITLTDKVLKKHTGGACEIQKRFAEVLEYIQDGHKDKRYKITLAVKKPKTMTDNSMNEDVSKAKNTSVKNMEYQLRFQREKKIVKYLNQKGGKKDYLLNYYEEKDNENIIYLDYHELNLNQFLYYYRELLNTTEIFSICKQILEIIQDLHDNGVVHRDLKPSNFMVDTSRGISLKLIDFSDSSICEEKSDAKLCGTLPYSPLESSKNSKKYPQEGISKPEIDYWSVGILLHQIFYGHLPLTYSPCLAKDIHSLWTTQFLYTVRCQKRRGLKIIDSGFQILNLLLVRVNPQERLSLGKAYIILCFLEKYYNQLLEGLFME